MSTYPSTRRTRRARARRRVTERSTGSSEAFFFELEWAALDDDRARSCSRTPTSTSPANTCATPRKYRPHSSPSREKLMARRASRRSAWGRSSPSDVGRRGSTASRSRSRSAGSCHPDREVRRTTAEAVTEALKPGLRTRATSSTRACSTSPSTTAAQLLELDPEPQPVERGERRVGRRARGGVRKRYEIGRRWYRSRRSCSGSTPGGLRRMGAGDRRRAARRLARRAHDGARVLQRVRARPRRASGQFFERNWIDAPVRPAKRGGASAPHGPSVHPYVLLQLHAKRRDVLTSRTSSATGSTPRCARAGALQQGTPLTLAETASVSASSSSSAGCSTRRATRSRASRCWPRRWRGRSPPSSARSR